MKRPHPKKWLDWLTENGSYKLVALFVTLILWVTILGRRDMILVEVEFLLPPKMTYKEQVDRRVMVKVNGPRAAIKRLQQSPSTIAIDLMSRPPGPVRAYVNVRSLEMNFGLKIVSVQPEYFDLTLVEGESAK